MWRIRRVLRRQRPPLQVTLYERPGCHLCKEAEQLLVRLAPRFPMQVTRVDITTDRDLLRRYDIRIPVILISGSMELEAPIEKEALEQALRAAGAASAGVS